MFPDKQVDGFVPRKVDSNSPPSGYPRLLTLLRMLNESVADTDSALNDPKSYSNIKEQTSQTIVFQLLARHTSPSSAPSEATTQSTCMATNSR